MLMLNLVAVVVTFVGFLFDILGTTSKALFFIRTNGLLSITTGGSPSTRPPPEREDRL